MIIYERFESTAVNYRATTRDCPYFSFLALFKTWPQNRVRTTTFAEQRRNLSGLKPDPTRFQIYIPPFNRFVFIFSNSLSNNKLRNNL